MYTRINPDEKRAWFGLRLFITISRKRSEVEEVAEELTCPTGAGSPPIGVEATQEAKDEDTGAAHRVHV